MSIEVDVLGELYTILKQYVPVKDRQEAADNVMSIMIDILNDLDLKEFAAIDSSLGKALKEYAVDDDDDEDHDIPEDDY